MSHNLISLYNHMRHELVLLYNHRNHELILCNHTSHEELYDTCEDVCGWVTNSYYDSWYHTIIPVTSLHTQKHTIKHTHTHSLSHTHTHTHTHVTYPMSHEELYATREDVGQSVTNSDYTITPVTALNTHEHTIRLSLSHTHTCMLLITWVTNSCMPGTRMCTKESRTHIIIQSHESRTHFTITNSFFTITGVANSCTTRAMMCPIEPYYYAITWVTNSY